MTGILERTAFIGFGEAGMAFAEQWGREAAAAVRAFDIKTDDPATAEVKWGDYAHFGVEGTSSLAEAIGGADLVISVVTADQAPVAARQAASVLKSGTLYCDFNSVAPQTKQTAAEAIETAGGRYADVAVMAPVRPARLAVPLLVSGQCSNEACAALREAGFAPRDLGGSVGQASIIKMLRSIMVKGMEALTAECFIAAHQAGVAEAVAASLNENWPGVDWLEKADYNLDRILVHGLRRAAEMDEVAATLEALGMPNSLTRATAETQRRIGTLSIPPAESFADKAESILGREGSA